MTTATTFPCSRCAGTGRLSCFSNVLGGVCFKCNGKGTQPSKPAAPSILWAVLGTDRNTGGRVRLYNIKAKNETAAIERARNTMAGASTAFKDQYTLEGAVAVRAAEMDQQEADQAITAYYTDRANSGQASLAH
jgi:hypothetical protein